MREKINSLLIGLVLLGIIFTIIYIVHLNNKIIDLKLDLINKQNQFRNELISEIQIKNKSIRDSVFFHTTIIKYFEKDTKDYEEYLKTLPIDKLVLEYWNTRPRLK